MNEAAQQRTLAWLIFAGSLAVYHAIFVLFFPTGFGEIGHDYTLALPGFYDGVVWLKQNGPFAIPWFTPSFCGGQPFYADPQSAYLSLPQWLMFFLPPLTALHVSLLILASVGYWGMFLLATRVFAVSAWCAALAGVFFMFNGFLSHRWIVGHTGFQGFALIPVIACLLIMARELPVGPVRWGGNALLAGVCIAYWPQSGMGSLIIPGALAVFALALLAGLRGRSLLPFFQRSAAAGTLAIVLSAAKLNAAFAMLSHFPRTDYKLPGLDGIYASVTVALTALNTSSLTTFTYAQQHLQNVQWALNTHEWAYGVTPVPMTLLALAGLFVAATARSYKRPSGLQSLGLVLLTAVLLVPIAINIYTPEWNSILKATPLLQSNSSLFRWYIIYIPILCVAAPLLLNQIGRLSGVQHWVVGALLVATLGFHAFEDRTYYFFSGSGHSPEPVTRAWHQLQQTQEIQPVNRIMRRVQTPAGMLANNQVIYGQASQPTCYNPIFGYRLENLPLAPLAIGPVTAKLQGDVFNMKNPACYVFPVENHCEPGDHFRLDQADALDAFRHYRPFPFAVSKRQELANWTTSTALVLTLIALLALALTSVRQFQRGLSG